MITTLIRPEIGPSMTSSGTLPPGVKLGGEDCAYKDVANNRTKAKIKMGLFDIFFMMIFYLMMSFVENSCFDCWSLTI